MAEFIVFGSGQAVIGENVLVSDGLIGSNDVVELRQGSQSNSGIRSGGEVMVRDNVNLVGDITARGGVEIGKNATVTGNVTAGGEVKLKQDGAHILGNVLAGGDLKIEMESTVTGDAGTNGNAELKKNATVTGGPDPCRRIEARQGCHGRRNRDPGSGHHPATTRESSIANGDPFYRRRTVGHDR